MKNIIRLTLIIIFSFQFFESKAQKLEQLIYENEERIIKVIIDCEGLKWNTQKK